MRYGTVIDSPVGRLQLCEKDGALTHLLWIKDHEPEKTEKGTEILDKVRGEICYYEEKITPLLKKTIKQLGEYFEGKRREFELPLAAEGTDFQEKCWKGISSIGYGKTESYKYIAEFAGSPKAFRAAGMACHTNPISIIVPCHRVIGSDGALTGFGGGMDRKIFLLELENKNSGDK